jgi:hypothetical protein
MADAHSPGHASDDVPGPVSTGVPPFARVMIVLAGLIILMQGEFCIASSGYARVWPATDSTKVTLPDYHP